METFKDTDIVDADDAKEVMHHYEWAIADSANETRIVEKWSTQNISIATNDQVSKLTNIMGDYKAVQNKKGHTFLDMLSSNCNFFM